MYQAPNIHPPSLEEVKRLSDSLNLGLSEEDIPRYHAIFSGLFRDYSVLEKYVEPKLPVKYPRTPGWRPLPEENKHNAWYYKCDIQGAPSGVLKGYRVAIKDSFPVAGVPMMHGSRVMEGYVPDYDPTVVTRLLDAGATIVGKATCEDFCYSGSSFTSHPFPVTNPHDPTRSTGGSSSGCAVVVQTSEADLALGGDQGGSVRMPSSFTGIVGFKATYGLVPYTGIASLAPQLDTCGPMARTVKDCALMLQVIAGYDGGQDPRQGKIPERDEIPKYSELLAEDVSNKKIGLLVEGFEGCEPEVAAVVRQAAESLRSKGAIVEDVSIPIHTDGVAIWGPGCAEGCYQAMLQSQGFPAGPPSLYPTSAIDNYFAFGKALSKDIPPTVKIVAMQGKYVQENYGMHFYAKSQNLTRLLRQRYDEALSKYDVLLMPTVKIKAHKLPNEDINILGIMELLGVVVKNAAPFSASGHPALSMNAGFSADGLPVGMMIVGQHLAEQTVLNVAYAYEQLLSTGQKE